VTAEDFTGREGSRRYGITPLPLAATGGNGALVEALVNAGANPTNRSPEDAAAQDRARSSSDGRTPRPFQLVKYSIRT